MSELYSVSCHFYPEAPDDYSEVEVGKLRLGEGKLRIPSGPAINPADIQSCRYKIMNDIHCIIVRTKVSQYIFSLDSENEAGHAAYIDKLKEAKRSVATQLAGIDASSKNSSNGNADNVVKLIGGLADLFGDE